MIKAAISWKVLAISWLLLSAPCWGAWGNDDQGCDGNEKTSDANVVCNVNGTIEAGHVLIIVVAANNVDTSDGNTTLCSSVSDTQTNSYAKLREFTNAQGSAAAGATVCIFYSILTTQLTVSDSITVNFSSSITAKAVDGEEFTIGAGNVITIEGTPQDLANDGADAGSMTVSGLPSAEYLFYRAIASETDICTIGTISTGFNETHGACTSGGGEASNMGAAWEYDIATATSSTSDPTMNDTSADRASIFLALKEAAPPATVSMRRRAVVMQ